MKLFLITLMFPFVFVATGCESGSGDVDGRPMRTIELSDFEQGAAQSGTRPARTGAMETDSTDTDQESNGAITVDPAAVTLGASGPGPIDPDIIRRAAAGDAIALEAPYIVESLIGQVNGRPIFADEFFEPIEDELRAEARNRRNDREYAQFAYQRIARRLNDVVLNELFLAEAEGKLNAEQQKGLLGFVRNLKEEIVAEKKGIASEAEARILEEEGMSLDDYIGERRDQELIRSVLIENVRPRVIVSWRDIERAYRMNFDEFNPPATISIQRITFRDADNASRILEIQDMIDGGASLEELGALPDVRVRGAQDLQMPDGTVDSMEIDERLRDAIRGVGPGQVSPQVVMNTSIWWIAVVKIDRPEGKSIYDPEVQAALRQGIFNQQFQKERVRYVKSLFDEGVQARLDEMSNRLLVIAFQRYGRPSDLENSEQSR